MPKLTVDVTLFASLHLRATQKERLGSREGAKMRSRPEGARSWA